MMTKNEINIEIGIAIEQKETYFQKRNNSPFDDLMFQFWCGIEIGLCLASGKLKPSYSEYIYGMHYSEYVSRCKGFFWNFSLGLGKYNKGDK